LRHPARHPDIPGARRLQGPGLRSVRSRMVSLFHAAAGRAAREPRVRASARAGSGTRGRRRMSTLAGRVVAITGASAGIGLALARQLLAQGASVAAFARRADRLNQLATEAVAQPGRLLTVTGDVVREADVHALVDRTME